MDSKATITFLEHLGQQGLSIAAPFAEQLGNVVNSFAPGAGDVLASLLKEVVSAESSGASNEQKLATVSLAMTPVIMGYVKQAKKPKVSPNVTQNINTAVSALNAVEVPADSPLPAAKSPGDLADEAGRNPQGG